MKLAVFLAVSRWIANVEAAAPSDLRRARQQTPSARVVGDGHVGMTEKLNKVLRAMPGATVKDCEAFSVQELVALQRKIHEARDPALEAIYQVSGDMGRSMRVFGTHAEDLETLEGLWEEEMQTLKQYPSLADVSRDFKCHEAVMWLVHHVPEAKQAELRKTLTLPLLPERDLHQAVDVPADVAAKFGGAGESGEGRRLQPGPPGGLGCDQAHAQQRRAKNEQYVEWPEELTYSATGHGAFPFWDNGGPGCSSCDPSVSGGAELKVMYSDKLKSEILMHASCGDMSWTRSSGAPKKSPCNHIFTPDEGAFIYTPKTSLKPEADGEFCCRSVPKGNTMFTGAVPRDWMKTAWYGGIHDNFEGDHFTGKVKMFTWREAGLVFWYYTTLDGKPVQQGESCYNPQGKKPQACGKMMPITLYHDFEPSSWQNATFASSDFTVPDVCKNTRVSCSIPGVRNNQNSNVDEVIV